MPDTLVGDGTADYELTSADLGASIYCKVTATNASGTANANSNTVGPVAAAAGGAYAGPGDVVSGAVAYWGLRAYSAAYAASGPHPAIDIRDAADTTTTTLNILATGALDVASVPGSGGPFKVSKVYDQVGSNHLIQVTHVNRPTLLLNAVGARPAFLSNGLTGWTTVAGITQAQPFTWSVFFKITDSNGGYQYMVYPAGNPVLILDHLGNPSGGPFTIDINAGSSLVISGLSIATWYGLQAVYNGSSSNLFINSTSNVGDAGTTGLSGANIDICSFDGGLNGPFTEIGLWPSSFVDASLADDMYSNQAAWWA